MAINKGVVPYLTLFGLIYRIPVTYIFEYSGTLIHLPPAPVSFDWRLLNRARDAFLRLRSEGAMEREQFFALISDADHRDRERLDVLLETDADMVVPSAIGDLIFETQQSLAANVYIGPHVQQVLTKAIAGERKVLETLLTRCADTLRREHNIHRFSGTDLLVSKQGNVAERPAYTERNGDVYVAEAYLSHDNYERDLGGRKVKDYKLEEFQLWEADQVEAELPTDAETVLSLQDELQSAKNVLQNVTSLRDSLSIRVEQLEEQRLALNASLQEKDARVEQFRRQQVASDRKKSALEKKLELALQDNDALRHQVFALEKFTFRGLLRQWFGQKSSR